MRRAIVLAGLLLVGCDLPKQRHFNVKLVRPDGVVHREYTGTKQWMPEIHGTRGPTWVHLNERTIDAPSGWLLEIEELREHE